MRPAQNCGLPPAVTRTSKCSGGRKSRLVSSYRPSPMRSSQTVKAGQGLPGLRRRAYEIRDRHMAGLHHAVAQPAHAAGLLNAIPAKSRDRD